MFSRLLLGVVSVSFSLGMSLLLYKVKFVNANKNLRNFYNKMRKNQTFSETIIKKKINL